MTNNPQLVYDRQEKAIYVHYGGGREQIHSEATRKEYAVVSDIDELMTNATMLSDTLIETLPRRQHLLEQDLYFDTLDSFQSDAGKYFQRCKQLQSVAERSSSEIVDAHVGQLYKLEKFLKHYFRQLSVAQSLGFSERLLHSYLSMEDYVYLYGFVRNACSTLEYLGILLENRLGRGSLELENTGLTFVRVYEELHEQNLLETPAPEQRVQIPLEDGSMRMGDLPLDSQEMRRLWDKRNDIVHLCPVVVDGKTLDLLPEDLLSAAVLTRSELDDLTQLAVRVDRHCAGLFIQLSKSYIEEMIEPFVEAWYHENPTDSGHK